MVDANFIIAMIFIINMLIFIILLSMFNTIYVSNQKIEHLLFQIKHDCACIIMFVEETVDESEGGPSTTQ